MKYEIKFLQYYLCLILLWRHHWCKTLPHYYWFLHDGKALR